MEKKDLKLVRGVLEQGKPAEILFFDDVEWWSCDRFVEEMQYIEDWIKPCCINILINSAGGNVIEGMKVFTKILNCKIPTTTTIAGIAASMGSIIWAAGQKLYMNDYSLLIIHNPWMDVDMSDPNNQQIIEAFKKQLTTVYSKRFGFSEEKVTEIMDGKEGCDGTFLTADQAVEQGFIPADHVIQTPETIRNKIAAAIKGKTDKDSIVAIMGLVENQNYLEKSDAAISDKEPKGNIQSNLNIIEDMENLKVIASQLGLQGEVSLEKVTAAIIELSKSKAELKTAKDELATVKSELNDLKIQHEGVKTSNANLQKELDETKAALQGYKTKEEDARNLAIEAEIDTAIKAGKIPAESKESWMAMAKQNFEMVKSTLASIEARNKISEKIAEDPANKEKAEKGMEDAEAKVKAKVDELVGADFKFHTLDELR